MRVLSIRAIAAGAFCLLSSTASADFLGWTANVRSVPSGFLVNVFAVSNSSTDTLVNRYGSVAGVSGGYVTTNASGGFRQGTGSNALFAPNGEQSWNSLDSFFTVGGAFGASGEWFAEPATLGDPNWVVPFTGTGCASSNSFSSNSTASCANPYLNSVPAAAGWYVSGVFAPVRSLATLDCRVASSSSAAAAAQYGVLVAQLYITDTAPNRTVSWRMGATMRHANGSVSQGIYEFVIPVNPLAVTTYTDAVIQSAPSSYWRFEESWGMAINAVAGGQFGALSGVVSRSQPSAGSALGNCYRFNNGAVTVPASAATNPSDSYSIELWARASTVTTTAVLASIGADVTPGSLKLNVYGPPLFVRGELRLSATQFARADWTSTDAELLQWHHYVFAVDRTAGYARLFIDGLLVQEQPWEGGAYPGLSAPLVIGQQALTGFTYPFYGDIDEIAVYRRALPAYEVRRHYCASGLGSNCESVRVPADFATIQAAIDSAPATASRFIAVTPGTYAGPIDFKGKNVIVWGEGRTGLTTLSGTGGQSVPVVKFAGNEPATSYLQGFTVRNGLTGGVIPTTTFFCGGGLLALNSGAGVRDCIFEANSAPYGGGAYLYRSTSTVQRCTFSGNQAQFYGGGLQAFGGSPKLLDSLVQNNSTSGIGGGMHAVEGTPTLRRTIIRSNSATSRFGGVSWDPSVAGAFMTVDDCEISSNSSAGSVGGFGVASALLETRASFGLSDVCNNLPRPNILGRYTDLGGNVICDCKGDLNFDGAVTGADLGLLLAAWGPCSGAVVCTADMNEDNTVNGADLGLLLAAWGCSQ